MLPLFRAIVKFCSTNRLFTFSVLYLIFQRSPSTTKKRQKMKPSPLSRDLSAANDSVSIAADSLDGDMSLVIDDTASLGSTDAGMLAFLFYSILPLFTQRK